MAKKQLEWMNESSLIANFSIGMPSAVSLLIRDPDNLNATFTFTKIGGDLPPGMTLSSAGVIAGTPTYSSAIDNYFVTRDYDFVVRATSSSQKILDGKFIIKITNVINQDFYWVTAPGNLGTIPNSAYYGTRLQANSSINAGISYSLLSGDLPPGMQLVSHNTTKEITVSQGALSANITANNVSTIGVEDFVYGNLIPAGTTVLEVYRDKNIVNLSANTTGLLQIGDKISFYSPGSITGTPTILDPTKINESRTYRFTVRASNTLNRVVDRSFTLSTTNISGPVIEPQTEFLGSVFDGTYYSKQLEVTQTNPLLQIEWSIVDGYLPPGMILGQDGKLKGWIEPVALSGDYGPAGYDGIEEVDGVITEEQQYDYGPYQFNNKSQSVAYSFTVRAFDGANTDLQKYVINVVSRTGWTADSGLSIDDGYLTIDSGNIRLPVLRDVSSILPTGREDSYYAYKFDGVDFDDDTIFYKLADTAGTFDGSAFDPLAPGAGNEGLPGSFDLVSTTASNLPGIQLDADTGWLYGIFNSQPEEYKEYNFGLQACKILLFGNLSNIQLTTNSNITVTTTDYITQKFGNLSIAANLAVMANTTGNTIYVTHVTGFSTTTSNNKLFINNVTSVNATVTSSSLNYQQFCSPPRFFTLPVIGDPNNVIQWRSPADLGVIENGQISDISIEAVSIAGKEIVYELVDESGVSCRLPQGLKLLSSGDISGRATFESFTLDDYATTIDSNDCTIDRECLFRVRATTTDGTASSTMDFTLSLKIYNTEPFENLYLKAMPTLTQRTKFNDLMSNEDIFDDESIYRLTDPYFGKSKDLKMLFLAGLTSSELDEYQTALERNHFRKTYDFGDVKTAYVLDSNYEIRYEVVYLEVLDRSENSDGSGPDDIIDLTNIIANPYIDENGNTYKILYPNNTQSMVDRIESQIGYIDQSSLPPWMTSNQVDPDNNNQFLVPLGYTKAAVLAYAKPGKGRTIAYRIRESGFNFDSIDFTVDRYQLDNFYSRFYNRSRLNYDAGQQTTFDATQTVNVGDVAGLVKYAVTVPYSQINGRPLQYILDNGGIDGIDFFADGDTLIFAQQENFENPGPYDGWVDYSAAWIGDNIETSVIEGFDSGSYDTYTVVPGFLEKSLNTSPVNKRGGIWRISINNSIVNLQFVKEVQLNQRVRVQYGKTFSSAVLFYSIALSPGQTVPFYDVFAANPDITRKPTTFNNNTTKFFSNHDTYYEPGTQDKYLKFPNDGVFH